MPLTRNQQAALVQQGQSSSTTEEGAVSETEAQSLQGHADGRQQQQNVLQSVPNVTTDNDSRSPSVRLPGSSTASAIVKGRQAQSNATLVESSTGASQRGHLTTDSTATADDWSSFQSPTTDATLNNNVFSTSQHQHDQASSDANNHVFDHAMQLSSTSFYSTHDGDNNHHSDLSSFINDTSNQNLVLIPDHQRHDRRQLSDAQASAEDNLMATLQSHINQMSPERSFNGSTSNVAPTPQRDTYNMAAAAATAAALSVNSHGRQRSDSTLSTAFSTPSMSRINSPHDHTRNFSLESMESVATAEARAMQRPSLSQFSGTAGSADSSLSMDLDSAATDSMQNASDRHLQAPASVVKRHSGAASDGRNRNVGRRQNRSLGQMGAAISAGGVEDGLLRLGNTIRPLAPNNFDRFGLHHASSARSLSPPEPGTIGFPGNFSPHSSISTIRHTGDSSIDTSTDSISNSATTMSGVPSQASSVSEDMMGGTGASKRLPKIKTRLRNIDRKAICEAARDDPKVRQEDLAIRFGIERSTVSKTLKNKEKWLAIEEESNGAMIMKHRLGKFPELEELLAQWITKEVGNDAPILDSTIKNRALQVAKDLGITLDQFKASVGWIDKFRERHKLRKVSAHSPDDMMEHLPGPMSGQSDEVSRQRARAFHSGMTLALQHQQERQNAMQHEINTHTGDSTASSDVSMFYCNSPAGTGGLGGQMSTNASSFSLPHSSTPQRPRSASDEGGVLSGIHETPKASKRQYDDMINAAVTARTNANINSSMENMRIPTDSPLQHQQHPHHSQSHQHPDHQNPKEQQRQAQTASHLSLGNGISDGLAAHRLTHDDSGYAVPLSDTLALPAPSASATSKRRKGVADPYAKDAKSANETAALTALREQIRRTRSEHFSYGQASTANITEDADRSNVLRDQQNQVAAAAVAAAQEIRRNEHLQSIFAQQQQHRGFPQQQGRQDDGGRTDNGDSADSALNASTASSPADQMSFMRAMQLRAMTGPTAQAALYAPHGSGHASPSSFRSDVTGSASMHPSHQQARIVGSPDVGTSMSTDDRPVTLDEARESLDVVLAFIARQPATLSPSDYFVLGNLQGQLNALANPYQHGHETPLQPATPMHTAHAMSIGNGSGGSGSEADNMSLGAMQQPLGGLSNGARSGHPGHAEALSHSNDLNLLGITQSELSMVGELPQHRGAPPSSA